MRFKSSQTRSPKGKQMQAHSVFQKKPQGPQKKPPLSRHALQLQSAIGNQAVGRLLNDELDRETLSDTRTPVSQSIAPAVREKMERTFDTDFSGVTIHRQSQQAVRLNASAFTKGQQIHFAPGQYQPHSSEGQQLLRHELTHVVQQRQGRVSPTTRMGGLPVNNEARLEAAAERASPALGFTHAATQAQTGSIQRRPSALQDFEHTYTGSIDTLKGILSLNNELTALFAEQFPQHQQNFAEFFELFGLNGLRREEEMRGETRNDTNIRIEKRGNNLNVEIGHKYISPLYNILQFDEQTPSLKLYKWFNTDEAPYGLGLRLFDAVQQSATGLGMNYLETDAIGDPLDIHKPEVGYYVWPRFGFDKSFEEENSDFGTTFFGRLASLATARDSMGQWEGELNQLLQQLDPTSTITSMKPKRRASELNHLRNQSQQYPLLENEQADLDYLEQYFKIRNAKADLGKHSEGLAWVEQNLNNLHNLSDLFTLPGTPKLKSQVAALWQAFGEPVHHGFFDLANQSTSKQVFEAYRNERIGRLQRSVDTLTRERKSLMPQLTDAILRLTGTGKRKKRTKYKKQKRGIEAKLGQNKKQLKKAKALLALFT